MKEHVNFYENLKEAHIRLRGSVVLYDGLPYYIMTITNHKKDGIFRVYMRPSEDTMKTSPYPAFMNNLPHDHSSVGPLFDDWLEGEGKTSSFIRKQMNSPLFNKFRPFPLGMCNYGLNTMYVERTPNRKTEQGLIRSMLESRRLSLNDDNPPYPTEVDMFTPAFKACILGEHPSAQECIDNLKNPTIENKSVAFHRNFALVRGPIDSLFLAYKSDIVGILPSRDLSCVMVGEKFRHTREVIAALNLFSSIN